MLEQSGHRRAIGVRTEEQCHALHWQPVSVVHQDVVALEPQGQGGIVAGLKLQVDKPRLDLCDKKHRVRLGGDRGEIDVQDANVAKLAAQEQLQPRSAFRGARRADLLADPGKPCYSGSMGIRDKWRQLKATAKGLFHKPAMIGTPPSARPMWHDPAAHAIDFSKRYAEPLDQYVTVRMEDLGIPKDRIGSSDHDHGIDWCAFNPYEDTGGGVGTEGQINVDSGIFNLELLTQSYGKKAGTLWARSPLPDRIDAIIAHEISEADHATHEAALKAAPQTEMPITHRAREILRAMERGWKGR